MPFFDLVIIPVWEIVLLEGWVVIRAFKEGEVVVVICIRIGESIDDWALVFDEEEEEEGEIVIVGVGEGYEAVNFMKWLNTELEVDAVGIIVTIGVETSKGKEDCLKGNISSEKQTCLVM